MAEIKSSFPAFVREVSKYSGLPYGRPLLGLTGPAQCGKDTIAERLMAMHGFVPTAFGDPAVNAVCEAFGIDHKEVAEQARNAYWGMAPRQMLERMRGAMAAQFGAEFWVRRWALTYNEIRDTAPCVVCDVATEIEAEAIRDAGGLIVHVSRLGCRGDDLIAFDTADLVLVNDGDLKALFGKVDDLIFGLEHYSITELKFGNLPIETAITFE